MSRPNWVGQTLGGRYKIEVPLGQGGMSSVYRAEDPNLHRTVAIKLIHSHLTGDPQFVRRFEAEAAAVAQLRHGNIIQVFDFNHDDDVYYMVLEYVPGETLQTRLRREGSAGRGLPADEAIRIAAGVADAVEYAHQHGLIHRDIKPANIMLNPQGEPILMDFGISKMMGGTTHTATGAVVGTATYISPEQVLGQRPTERSDIYSLGVTLYEMVAGRPPFEADSAMSLMMMHVNATPPDLRTLSPHTPPALIEVIEKSLSKDPEQRYPTAAALAAALRGAAGQPAPARRPSLDDSATVTDEPRPPLPRPTSELPRAPSAAGAAATPRRSIPVWALVGLPVAALVCLVVGVLGSLAAMNALRTPTAPPATQPPTAAVVATDPAPTEAPSAVVAVTDTPPAPPTATTALEVPPGMVLAPAGTFEMGSTEGAEDEQPPHTVTLGAFFIDRVEVTNARYRACVEAGTCTAPSRTNSETVPNYFNNPAFDTFPVLNVTWDQAVTYCTWDNGKRLPTEAEWEYAATGGDGRRFPWGEAFDAGLVPSTTRDTVAVSSFAGNASPFGAVDMAGNALEWVADVYDSQFYAESPIENPLGPAAGTERVLRGGSFGTDNAAVYTTTRRYHKPPTQTDVDIGFRCVLSVP